MIRLFLLNLLLALVYVALTGEPTGANFLIGFGLGFVVLTIYARAAGDGAYVGRFFRLIRFGLWFLGVLVRANLQVAWEVVTPGLHMTPRVIRYDVRGMTPGQITALATAISLTPGTLTADIDESGGYLYIHCMYARDREAAVRDLDDLKQRLLREVFYA
ncbi:MAG: Na+/H+ antiporter subunit E [Phycisphaeraceae bacterium]